MRRLLWPQILYQTEERVEKQFRKESSYEQVSWKFWPLLLREGRKEAEFRKQVREQVSEQSPSYMERDETSLRSW